MNALDFCKVEPRKGDVDLAAIDYLALGLGYRPYKYLSGGYKVGAKYLEREGRIDQNLVRAASGINDGDRRGLNLSGRISRLNGEALTVGGASRACDIHGIGLSRDAWIDGDVCSDDIVALNGELCDRKPANRPAGVGKDNCRSPGQAASRDDKGR